MTLSIITINYNNAEGLRITLSSVASQTYAEIEHIIIDGGSMDESVDVIREYESSLALSPHRLIASRLKWISEKDTGIYNAMNKGIRMATGEYCQFLNSGDMLAADDVTERMMAALQNKIKQQQQQHNINNPSVVAQHTTTATENNTSSPHRLIASSPYQNHPTIFYGNMKKLLPNGKILHDACNGGNDVTLDMFYRGCLNHSPAYIKRSLFDKYGIYDESLRICSDWKFYMQSIVLGGEKVQYVDIDMTLFDMTGISETNKDLLNNERNQLLKEMVPPGILRDYDNYHFIVHQYKRLKKHHMWGLVYFIERVLFKLEKWHILR